MACRVGLHPTFSSALCGPVHRSLVGQAQRGLGGRAPALTPAATPAATPRAQSRQREVMAAAQSVWHYKKDCIRLYMYTMHMLNVITT